MQGDQLNQYCSAPQSVATLTLQGMNVSGTIPQTVFSQLVDLQTLMLDDNPVLPVQATNCLHRAKQHWARTDRQCLATGSV